MTPFELQEQLAIGISNTVNLQSTANKTKFNVYKQNLPPKKDAKDDSMYPFCLITLVDGEQDEEAIQDVVFTFGVKDSNSDYQGFRDVVNAIEKVRSFLIGNQEIGERFCLKFPLRWTYPDSTETYPFYFGAIIATYTIPQINMNNQFI